MFGKCKQEQDKAIPFVARCRTSVTNLVKQYEILIELDDALQKLETKIKSVFQDSEEAAKQPDQRLTIILVTCTAFITNVNSILALTENLQSSRSNRAVSTLVESVTFIQQVTVWPVCATTEITVLTSIVTVIVEQRTEIETQMIRINQMVLPQIEMTLSADVIPNVDIAPTPVHEPPHVGNEVIAANVAAGITIPTCTTDEDCSSAAAKDITTQTKLIYCLDNTCVECKTDTNCGACQECSTLHNCVKSCSDDQSCIDGTCTNPTTTTTTTTTTSTRAA